MGPTTSVDPLRWWESVSSPGGKKDKEGQVKERRIKRDRSNIRRAIFFLRKFDQAVERHDFAQHARLAAEANPGEGEGKRGTGQISGERCRIRSSSVRWRRGMRGKPSPPGRERDRSYKRRKRGWGRDIDGGKAAGKCFESATPEDC
jgi:hypothetical protein